MKKIHCEPHETGISFEYEGAMHRSSQKASVVSWAAAVSRFGGELAGDRPPRYGEKTESSRGTGPRATSPKIPPPTTVGRGPVPRHASVLTANVHGLLGCGQFSFWRRARGGQAPALRSPRRFSFGSNTRGGQAPRYENSGVSDRGLRSVRP